MKYTCFEELPVWQQAIDLAVSIFELTAKPCFKFHSGTRNQLENATVSISNNIAEGFERGTTQETLTFIYIACGSSGEVRSMLRFLYRASVFSEIRQDVSSLIPQSVSISRQLRSWADSLQNSDIRGQRYLNERSRQIAARTKEREEFLQELKNIREADQSGSKSNK